jgi:hypothetical protein
MTKAWQSERSKLLFCGKRNKFGRGKNRRRKLAIGVMSEEREQTSFLNRSSMIEDAKSHALAITL